MTSHKVEHFLTTAQLETPFLVIELETIAQKYQTLQGLFPKAQVYYAIKANPEPEVLNCLQQLGAKFDAASIFEIHKCLEAGAQPEQISYGNTIKKAQDIAKAYALGIQLYSFDSLAELEKLATHAPGARVSCRLLIETQGAEWSLGRKFGCEPEMAYDLLVHAQRLGLVPEGVAFHVGSQQTDPCQWDQPIRLAAELFKRLRQVDVHLNVLNLGGGFPAHYRASIPEEITYSEHIQASLIRHFGAEQPLIMLEPGRSLVADAGTLYTEVVLIAKKSYADDLRWVFLDAGKFNGLIETWGDCIQYRIVTAEANESEGYDPPSAMGRMDSVILAGPTCDSADIIYEKADYKLPLSLKIGDRLKILSTGAYSHTYASVGFNGFPPIQVYCV